MGRFYHALRKLRPWSQPAIYVGAATIAAIWIAINFHLAVEHDRSVRAATKSTGNLARVFEEHIAHSLTETDRALTLLRSAYLASGNFDLARSLTLSRDSDLIIEFRIVGPDGDTLASTRKEVAPRTNTANRDFFLAQLGADADELFIGKPFIGRKAGTWLLELSRPIRSADGAFQGAIVAALDPRYLAKFYHSIDVGHDGAIFLAGLDGIVRASGGFKSDVIGGSMLGSQLFRRIQQADTGSFLTEGNQDGIRRYISYRVVKGYPLVVYVGQAQQEVLANYWHYRRSYFGMADLATILIVFVMGVAVRYRGKLNATQDALQASEARARAKSLELEVTLEHMSQGIMMVDADRNIIVMNARVIELLGLPQDYFAKPLKLDGVRSYLRSRGELVLEGGAPDPKPRDLAPGGGVQDGAYEHTRPNGMTLEVETMTLPDGGVVRTISDVSERKRKEIQIAHMARHDALTDLANRTLLSERIAQALAHLRRQQQGFALFYLDLDRFKAVNDAHGHPAGDALLRSVAERLSACVRETDTIARLGGDEFAILQDTTDRKEDAEVLAQRILASVGAPYQFEGYHAVVGVSIGIAMAPCDGTSSGELFKAADAALYRAKLAGGNAYGFSGRSTEASPAPRKLLSAAR
ncbi:MAG TPA: diguanylate cyclase [Xanthobacteraceae bacterium]